MTYGKIDEDAFDLIAQSVMRISITLVACFFMSACSNFSCVPGTGDGPWKPIGQQPPPILEIKKSLVGMKIDDADKFFSINGKPVKDDERVWTFEHRTEIRETSCRYPDVVKYYQNFLVVDSKISDGKIVSCEISIRGSLSEKVRSAEEMLRSPPGPLDENIGNCSIP